MAGSRVGMAESTVRLLMADAATVPRPAVIGRHHHAFWQLDHCTGGGFTAELAGGSWRMRRGQGLLLPPGVEHGFRYGSGARFVSWKFSWPGPVGVAAVRLAGQPGWAGLAAALAATLAAGPAAVAVPHLLAAALVIAGAPAPATGFVAELISLLEAHPERSWSVAAVARSLGQSPGHVSARFRSERGLTLKRWLDVRRAEVAGRALAGSDLGIADIAYRYGFSDQFAFSRFFHRVTGQSPSSFRARPG